MKALFSETGDKESNSGLSDFSEQYIEIIS